MGKNIFAFAVSFLVGITFYYLFLYSPPLVLNDEIVLSQNNDQKDTCLRYYQINGSKYLKKLIEFVAVPQIDSTISGDPAEFSSNLQYYEDNKKKIKKEADSLGVYALLQRDFDTSEFYIVLPSKNSDSLSFLLFPRSGMSNFQYALYEMDNYSYCTYENADNDPLDQKKNAFQFMINKNYLLEKNAEK